MSVIKRIMIAYSVVAITICLAGFLVDYNLLSGLCVLINSVALYFWCKYET